MAKRKQPGAGVSQKDIASVARKLDAWGAGLSASERAALQVVTSRAQSVTPAKVSVTQVRARFTDALRSVFADLNKSAGGPWIREGPIWPRSKVMPEGEEIEITGSLIVRNQQR